MSEVTDQIEKIGRAIWPAVSSALGGQPTPIQGAALADLTARWLAGHVIRGDPVETAALRETLLDLQLRTIRELIPLHEPPA